MSTNNKTIKTQTPAKTKKQIIFEFNYKQIKYSVQYYANTQTCVQEKFFGQGFFVIGKTNHYTNSGGRGNMKQSGTQKSGIAGDNALSKRAGTD